MTAGMRGRYNPETKQNKLVGGVWFNLELVSMIRNPLPGRQDQYLNSCIFGMACVQIRGYEKVYKL